MSSSTKDENNTVGTLVPATRARFIVAVWLCSMAAVLYLDRVCWSKAAPAIQKEFSLSNLQMAYLAMSFQIAYGIFEVPTGRWGDLLGARRILTRITLWWSAFTAMTGVANGFGSLLVIRFLFGAGEAGAYPNAARILTRWFPKSERGRVQGAMLSVSLIGGAIAPWLASRLIEMVGWKWNFAIFGLFGVLWAVGFWYWFRDAPEKHPRVNALELKKILDGREEKSAVGHGSIPWRTALTNRGIMMLSLIIMCSSFNSYFYFTWFPSYLESAHGLSNLQSGNLTSMALSGAAAGVLIGGIVVDWLTRNTKESSRIRNWFCAAAFLMGASLLALATKAPNAHSLSLYAAFSCFFVQLTLPCWWSAAIEQCGKHVGPLFGFMNMMGTMGALASQWFVGYFADLQKLRGLSGREQWDPMFGVYVVVLIVGGVGWSLHRRVRALEND